MRRARRRQQAAAALALARLRPRLRGRGGLGHAEPLADQIGRQRFAQARFVIDEQHAFSAAARDGRGLRFFRGGLHFLRRWDEYGEGGADADLGLKVEVLTADWRTGVSAADLAARLKADAKGEITGTWKPVADSTEDVSSATYDVQIGRAHV